MKFNYKNLSFDKNHNPYFQMIFGNIIIEYEKTHQIDIYFIRKHVHNIISKHNFVFYRIKRTLIKELVVILDVHFMNYKDIVHCLNFFLNEKIVSRCFYKQNILPDKNYNHFRSIDDEFLSSIENKNIELSIITSDNFVYYN
jgi:hypothetical protein